MTASFENIAHRWLESFAQDLKDFMHVLCDDADLDDPLREAAVGAVLYALAPGDVVPDSAGPLGYVDDALALRIVLDEVRVRAPARFEAYGSRLPDMLGPLADDVAVSKKFFDEAYDLFRGRVMSFEKLEFKGKRVRDVLDDPAWLEEEVAVAALKHDFKPNDVQAATKRLNTLPPLFRQKLAPRK
jgi:uncharacterized membrane protein YkvA (DUF1232 family)